MPLIPRILMIAALILALAGEVAAQATATVETTDTAATTTAPAETATASEPVTAEGAERTAAAAAEAREAFTRLLNQHPPQLTRILLNDPQLLNNEPFLARYPEVADFLTRHPEIRRNPHYFLGDFELGPPRREKAPYEDTVEAMGVLAIFVFITFVLGWAVRTYIEQKRWNRLSARQAEIHNRILERFSTSEELLAYIRTPAGTRFLESAPIPVQSERPSGGAGNRMVWSVQVGIIVAAGALGMLLVSLRLSGEASYAFFAFGVIGFCVGAGFIASAVVALMLSKRLGPFGRTEAEPGSSLDDGGVVR